MLTALRTTQGAFSRSLMTSIALHAGVLACGVLAFVPSPISESGGREPAVLTMEPPRPVPEEPVEVPESLREIDPVELPEPRLEPVRPDWTEAELATHDPAFELPPDPAQALASVSVAVFAQPSVDEPEVAAEPAAVEPVARETDLAEAEPVSSEPVSVAAQLTERPDPPYPAMSVRLSEAGTVRCRLHVDATGSVTKVEIVRSSGFARLDESARKTLLTWRFAPATTDGVAEATTLEHDVEFRMES